MTRQEQAFCPLVSVTIQGGGVFGLSLLGQLRAVEDQKFQVAVYAGSSAGALIATLAWAGYSSQEILAEVLELVRTTGLNILLRNVGSSAEDIENTRTRKIQSLYAKLFASGTSMRRQSVFSTVVDTYRILRLVWLVRRAQGFQ